MHVIDRSSTTDSDDDDLAGGFTSTLDSVGKYIYSRSNGQALGCTWRNELLFESHSNAIFWINYAPPLSVEYLTIHEETSIKNTIPVSTDLKLSPDFSTLHANQALARDGRLYAIGLDTFVGIYRHQNPTSKRKENKWRFESQTSLCARTITSLEILVHEPHRINTTSSSTESTNIRYWVLCGQDQGVSIFSVTEEDEKTLNISTEVSSILLPSYAISTMGISSAQSLSTAPLYLAIAALDGHIGIWTSASIFKLAQQTEVPEVAWQSMLHSVRVTSIRFTSGTTTSVAFAIQTGAIWIYEKTLEQERETWHHQCTIVEPSSRFPAGVFCEWSLNGHLLLSSTSVNATTNNKTKNSSIILQLRYYDTTLAGQVLGCFSLNDRKQPRFPTLARQQTRRSIFLTGTCQNPRTGQIYGHTNEGDVVSFSYPPMIQRSMRRCSIHDRASHDDDSTESGRTVFFDPDVGVVRIQVVRSCVRCTLEWFAKSTSSRSMMMDCPEDLSSSSFFFKDHQIPPPPPQSNTRDHYHVHNHQPPRTRFLLTLEELVIIVDQSMMWHYSCSTNTWHVSMLHQERMLVSGYLIDREVSPCQGLIIYLNQELELRELRLVGQAKSSLVEIMDRRLQTFEHLIDELPTDDDPQTIVFEIDQKHNTVCLLIDNVHFVASLVPP